MRQVTQITIEKNDEKLTYNLSYNETKLIGLIRDIIEDCSVRKRIRTYTETKKIKKDDIYCEIDSISDFNQNQVHQNADDLRFEPKGEYWERGFPEPISFMSDKLMSPKLVGFLENVLNGKDIDYGWFSGRKELNEKANLRIRMKKLDSQINKISNYDTERKIKELENFGYILQQFKDYPDFDFGLLSKYYDKAEKHLKLNLVQKTTYYKKH